MSHVAAAQIDSLHLRGCLGGHRPRRIRDQRFDLGLEPFFHLYDRDICFQARSRGHRVVVVETHATHHFRRGGLASREDFVQALLYLNRKWATGAR